MLKFDNKIILKTEIEVIITALVILSGDECDDTVMRAIK
jgi:hypothetical protein